MESKYRWNHQSSEVIQSFMNEKKMAILPLGATEDHGPHLPVGTDNFICQKVCGCLAEKTGDIILPSLAYTYVWSLGDRVGTISLSFDTLRDTIKEIACELFRQGIKMLVCVDAHIGNTPVVKAAFRDALEIHPDMRCMYFAYLDYASSVSFSSPRASGKYIHACEIETSAMLYAKPELVAMDKAVKNYPDIPKRSQYLNIRWSEFTDIAVLGDATCGKAEKGEELILHAVEEIAKLMEEERKRL